MVLKYANLLHAFFSVLPSSYIFYESITWMIGRETMSVVSNVHSLNKKHNREKCPLLTFDSDDIKKRIHTIQ